MPSEHKCRSCPFFHRSPYNASHNAPGTCYGLPPAPSGLGGQQRPWVGPLDYCALHPGFRAAPVSSESQP